MLELADGFHFAAEASDGMRILQAVAGKHFDGHDFFEAHVASFVDRAHAAFAKLFENFIAADRAEVSRHCARSNRRSWRAGGINADRLHEGQRLLERRLLAERHFACVAERGRQQIGRVRQLLERVAAIEAGIDMRGNLRR